MSDRELRILIISNHYPPDVNPSGKIMRQLADGLRELGHTVDVLTTFPHYQSFRIEQPYRGRLVAAEHIERGRITRVWSFASGRKGRMLHRLANYLSFNLLASAFGSLSRRRYDIVLANSGSFFTGVTSWLLRLLRRAPFIYNVQDIYPDVPVRAGQLRNRVAIAGLERIESFMYRKADHITVISNEQRAVLGEKGVPLRKISVIPNFVDTAFIRPLPKDNEWSRRHELHDKFVIAHAGNLGYAYDFASLLAAAEALRAEKDICFLIIGDGVLKDELQLRINEPQRPNIRMLPFQPEADLPWLRAAIDVHLSLYARGAVQSSLPSKIYEIMACARPAIVSAEHSSDLSKLVEMTGCGICVEPEDVTQLTDAIRRLHADRQYGALLGLRGREAAVKHYSKEAAVLAYAQLLRQVANIDKVNVAAQ